MTQTFTLAVLDVSSADAPPSHLTEQLIEQDAALGRELLGHDDFTGNDAEGVLRALQPGPSRRHWMVVALDRLPAGDPPADESSGLPLVPGRGDVDPGVRLLGSVHCGAPLQEDTERLDLDLGVLPEARRQGVGAALHRAAEDIAHRHGRTLLGSYSAQIPTPDLPGEHALEAPTGYGVLDRRGAPVAFPLTQGYRLVQTETHSQLVPAEGLVRCGELQREIEPFVQDYEVVTWAGTTPPEHVEGMCELYRRMSTDLPHGDTERDEAVWTPERVAENDQRREETGMRTIFAMARHRETGQAVAYTYLATPRRRPQAAYQEDTLVAAEHRGHRLGMLVKLAALRRLGEEWPQVERIHTWNAGENAHMLAINEALGYHPVSIEGIWEKQLA